MTKGSSGHGIYRAATLGHRGALVALVDGWVAGRADRVAGIGGLRLGEQ